LHLLTKHSIPYQYMKCSHCGSQHVSTVHYNETHDLYYMGKTSQWFEIMKRPSNPHTQYLVPSMRVPNLPKHNKDEVLFKRSSNKLPGNNTNGNVRADGTKSHRNTRHVHKQSNS